MEISFDDQAWDDFCHWLDTDVVMAAKVRALIKDALRSPFSGLGKPEPLRGNWQGYWSRRISDEHRLVYRVRGRAGEQVLEIAICRYHYDKR
jgi:toxin YoeB